MGALVGRTKPQARISFLGVIVGCRVMTSTRRGISDANTSSAERRG